MDSEFSNKGVGLMLRVIGRGILLFFVVMAAVAGNTQTLQSEYVDLQVAGQWKPANGVNGGAPGAETYYDPATGSMIQIKALAAMQKVPEITKFFQASQGPNSEATQLLSAAAFPLPDAYTSLVSKDLANGIKPPRLWEIKDGEGNPSWFYTSQLFNQYVIRGGHGGSEIAEEYAQARVLKAEHQSLNGGEVLLFEFVTDRSSTDPAVKRFHMPSDMKDQKIRFTWIQYSPGGLGANQGVLSVVAASAANSSLTGDELLKDLASAKLK
jgi:hypothetical protein